VEQIGALWMDFLEMRILRKSVRKYSFHWKSHRNNGHFTWRPINILIVSRSLLLRLRHWDIETLRHGSVKSCRENQNTFCIP
jgi:hypothetical protein